MVVKSVLHIQVKSVQNASTKTPQSLKMENVFATNLDGKNLISLDSVITVLSKDANHVLGVAFFALNALIPKPISKVASVSALKTTP